jgi:hypothetical protein
MVVLMNHHPSIATWAMDGSRRPRRNYSHYYHHVVVVVVVDDDFRLMILLSVNHNHYNHTDCSC